MVGVEVMVGVGVLEGVCVSEGVRVAEGVIVARDATYVIVSLSVPPLVVRRTDAVPDACGGTRTRITPSTTEYGLTNLLSIRIDAPAIWLPVISMNSPLSGTSVGSIFVMEGAAEMYVVKNFPAETAIALMLNVSLQFCQLTPAVTTEPSVRSATDVS